MSRSAIGSSLLILLACLPPGPALGALPDPTTSRAAAAWDSLCPGNAADVLVVEVVVRDAFTLPEPGWPASGISVRCADSSGAVVTADAPTDSLGHTTITTTIGALLGGSCCDSLTVSISSSFLHFDLPVGRDPGPAGPLPQVVIPNPSPSSWEQFGRAAAAFQGDFLVASYDQTVTRMDGRTGAVLSTFHAPGPDNVSFGTGIAEANGGVLIGDPDAGIGGRAYLFDGQASLRFPIPDPAPGAGDQFAGAVAFLAGTIFLGAPGNPPGGTVYAFDAADGSPLFEIPGPHAGAGFGSALGVLGSDLIVGAPGDNGGDGSVHLYAPDGAPLLHVEGSTGSGDGFGDRVAAFNGDLVVGSRSGTDLQVLDHATGSVLTTIPLAGPLQGGAVVATGSYILYGLPLEDDVLAAGAGFAYVHDGATGALVARIRNPAPWINDHFGQAIATTETAFLIGSPGSPSFPAFEFYVGRAYLYVSGPTGAPVTAPAGLPRLTAAPNPFRTATTIRFATERPGPVTVSVHDVSGRMIRRLESPSSASGARTLTWDGRDQEGTPVAAGVYFVRLRGPDGGNRTGRVVRLR